MRVAILLITLLVGGCGHAGSRYARNFVHLDALGEAEDTVFERCGGDYNLIPGRAGYGPEDYACLPVQQNNAEVARSSPPQGHFH